MRFDVPGTAYDRFMGRYSRKLAPLFVDFARVSGGMRVLDVGCGPGALTEELARRTGAAQVAGIEPSAAFVEACRARLPDADIRQGGAETLPWAPATFDGALSQLVLSFVSDATAVASEMRRVVRPGGVLGACMWHEGASLQMSDVFWSAAATIDPAVRQAERAMRFRKQGEIVALLARAGVADVTETFLEVRVTYSSYDDFWEPITTAAGPIGAYIAKASAELRAELREACRRELGDPAGPFELSARACAARGNVP